MSTITKKERLDFRVTSDVKRLLSLAAEISKMSISDFVLRPAIERAENIISEQSYIKLDKKQWTEFCNLLDQPPKENPALKKLLTEKSIFD